MKYFYPPMEKELPKLPFNLKQAIDIINGDYQYVFPELVIKKKKPTHAQIAKAVGTTLKVLRRVLNAYYDGGEEAVMDLKFGRGGKPTHPGWTEEELNWAVSRKTLRRQAGDTLEVKCKKFA